MLGKGGGRLQLRPPNAAHHLHASKVHLPASVPSTAAAGCPLLCCRPSCTCCSRSSIQACVSGAPFSAPSSPGTCGPKLSCSSSPAAARRAPMPGCWSRRCATCSRYMHPLLHSLPPFQQRLFPPPSFPVSAVPGPVFLSQNINRCNTVQTCNWDRAEAFQTSAADPANVKGKGDRCQ